MQAPHITVGHARKDPLWQQAVQTGSEPRSQHFFPSSIKCTSRQVCPLKAAMLSVYSHGLVLLSGLPLTFKGPGRHIKEGKAARLLQTTAGQCLDMQQTASVSHREGNATHFQLSNRRQNMMRNKHTSWTALQDGCTRGPLHAEMYPFGLGNGKNGFNTGCLSNEQTGGATRGCRCYKASSGNC